jgi:drug/metabolite transporter (DMT)-like permease
VFFRRRLWLNPAMLAAFITTILWAGSAVCGARSAKIMGGNAANFWRLLCATLVLGAWAHLFGQGLGGASFPFFFLSGLIGVGADVFLFQSYLRLGSRLTILIIQCGAAIFGAAIEWIWQGSQLTAGQIAACATILAGVGLALAPGHHLKATRKMLVSGVAFSVLGALGNGFGAVLSRKAFAVAKSAGENIGPATSAYQRLIGGLLVGGISFLAVEWRHRGSQPVAPQAIEVPRAEKWRMGWPWVFANAILGQVVGMSCYQWALKTTSTGIVLAIISTAPLVVIPFSSVVEGEKVTWRVVLGAALAVLGAVALTWATKGK